MGQMIFQPLRDGYILSTSAGTAFNDGTLLAGRFSPLGAPGGIARALLAYDVSPLPSWAKINAAELRMTRAGGSTTGTPTFTARGLSIDTWGEDATWNSPWSVAGGDFSGTNQGSVVYGGSGNLTIAGLAALVKSRWVANREVGLVVQGDETAGASNYLALYSSEGLTPPLLVVDFEVGARACLSLSTGLKWSVTPSVEGCGGSDPMGYQVFEVGSVVRLPATFRDAVLGGVLDPDQVNLTLTTPSGTESTYTFGVHEEITRADVGEYLALVDASELGMWKARWWSTGDGQAAEVIRFKVLA